MILNGNVTPKLSPRYIAGLEDILADKDDSVCYHPGGLDDGFKKDDVFLRFPAFPACLEASPRSSSQRHAITSAAS